MVVIKDRTKIADLGNDFFKDIDCNGSEFDEFYGTMFNANIDVIEKYLFPRFQKICLVIGMGDGNAKSGVADYIEGMTNERFKILEKCSEEMKNRLQDGSLTIRFTHKRLVHTKLYVLASKDSNKYRAYSGSMNLSEKALHDNFEMLLCDYGLKEDKLYQEIYQSIFDQIYDGSADFADRKIINGFFGKTTVEEKKIYLLDETVSTLTDADNTIGISAKEILSEKRELNGEIRDFDVIQKEKRDSIEVLNLIYDSKGFPKEKVSVMDDEPLRKKLLNVVYHDEDPNERFVFENVKASDYYPKPLFLYDDDEKAIFETPMYGSSVQHKIVPSCEISKQDVKDICDIVFFYRDNKQDDESQAVFSFLMYVLESANIWKIRKVISEHGGIVENVPVVAALIGQGETGKTTLLKIVSCLTIGSKEHIVNAQDDMFKLKAGVKEKLANNQKLTEAEKKNPFSETPLVMNKNTWEFIQRYMLTKSSITPICIDDPNIGLIQSKSAENPLKYLSNTYKGAPHPVVLIAMNDRNHNFSIPHQIGRRAYAFGQENQFRQISKSEANQLTHFENDLSNQVFLYLTYWIDAWLDNVSDEDYENLSKDFLYPVKQAFKGLLSEHALYDGMKRYFESDNYDIKNDNGRRNWLALLSDKNVLEKISFNKGDETAFIPKDCFPGRDGVSRYFDYLPAKLEICPTQVDAGLSIVIDNMDSWLGNSVLREKYRADTGLAHDEHEIKIAKIQAIEQGKAMAETQFKLQQEVKKQEEEKRMRKKLGYKLKNLFRHDD